MSRPAAWFAVRASACFFAILLGVAGLAACATPVEQPCRGDAVAPRLEADRVIAADGAVLPLSVWRPPGEVRAVVLALHGFNDYRHAFADVGPFLARRGVVTYAYDQRGFGRTAGRGLWPCRGRLVDDARRVAALLRESYPGRLLADTPAAADGAVLVAAAVWSRATMNPLQRAALWLVAHTLPDLQLSGRGLGIRASDNDAMLHALREDPLVLKKARADTLWGLADLMDGAFAAAPRLTTPTLVLYGERDQIIPRRPFCRTLATLPPAARVAVYPDGYHMLTRDLGASAVLADLAAWLGDRGAPLPSGHEFDRQRERALKTLCAS